MKTLIIAYIALAGGGAIELEAPSLEACELAMLRISQGATVEIGDEFGVFERVTSIDCKAQQVHVPEAEGEDV